MISYCYGDLRHGNARESKNLRELKNRPRSQGKLKEFYNFSLKSGKSHRAFLVKNTSKEDFHNSSNLT